MQYSNKKTPIEGTTDPQECMLELRVYANGVLSNNMEHRSSPKSRALNAAFKGLLLL